MGGFWIPRHSLSPVSWFGPVKMATILQEVLGISATTLEDLGTARPRIFPLLFKPHGKSVSLGFKGIRGLGCLDSSGRPMHS